MLSFREDYHDVLGARADRVGEGDGRSVDERGLGRQGMPLVLEDEPLLSVLHVQALLEQLRHVDRAVRDGGDNQDFFGVEVDF